MTEISKLIKKASKLCGGQQNLAFDLGLASQGQISGWINSLRPVPAHHCVKIEELTKGEVSRYDLRPDVFGEHPDKESRAA
ncbi:hypothetical protein A3765_28625 [Oleiphilus sp. HI0130]|nr:hypothetical protein A3765_28910 [Oleiphilus sp. HI0130]KZZ72518.1 hypothetical protein A3765_28625 [Oleiphilus sp. HI0130]